MLDTKVICQSLKRGVDVCYKFDPLALQEVRVR
jgi:hypothetical protein